MIKKFIAYYKPHKKIFVLDMIASLAMAAIAILYPIITRQMLNDLIPNKKFVDIVIYGVGLLVLYVVRMFLNYYVQYYGHMMGVGMQANMRRDLFDHLQKLPFSYFDNHETGKIMSRMTTDLFDVSELAHHGPENILISSISIVASFIYLLNINIWLTMIIFTAVPFLFIISFSLRKKMRIAFTDTRKTLAEINASIESSISGIRVTKAFNNSKIERNKFEVGINRFIEARKDSYKAMGQFHSGTTFITDVFNVIVLIAGGIFLYNGKINFGDYSAFIVSVNLFINPVTTLINFMEMYQNGITGFERFIQILEEVPEDEREEKIALENVKGDIELKNVTYSYEVLEDSDNEHSIKEEGAHILDNISLKIENGSVFALVGPSGGGKTTICHLIPQFYDYKDGSITIDGTELHDISLKSLRENIGIVQQDIYLFNSSIKDNILYGKPNASDEEVIEAAKRANIHDFIMSLEHGYDTEIGERGVRLSGGQKQRLSIARVFLKNPPILILDEATSALDNTTEIYIQKSLDELCKGRTTIVVAHRLSTIKNADKIAVIVNGKLEEIGNHEDLMNKNGIYADLYRLQFRSNNGYDAECK